MADEPEGIRRVVVIYPVSDGQPGIALFDQGLRSVLNASYPKHIEIYNEYLDAARFPDVGYQQRLAEFLRDKYADRQIEAVITGLAPSLDFVLTYREVVFPGVPILFGGIDRRELKARALGPGVVGVPMNVDLAATLDVALQLRPRTRRVVVVAGRSKTDSSWVAEARSAFQPYGIKVKFDYRVGLPIEDLLREVARLPQDCIVYYLNLFEDGRGRSFVPADVAERLAAAASVPVFGHFRTYLGRGIVGGRLVDFQTEGENVARLTARVLAGERPDSIPLADSIDPPYMFDWPQLERWGIGEETLPASSVVLSRPPSFWDLYKWRILGVISVCVVQTLLIVGLLVERAKRRIADERFRQTVAAAPSGMILVGRDGEIVLMNPRVETLFGYTQQELIGRPVEWLVPERVRHAHTQLRGDYGKSPVVRPMGPGLELHGRRKDGSEFPVEIALNSIRSGTNSFVLASITDITERKRADERLREGQRELRALTGRLLKAQEMERRRIARELHDDLNQDLALMAVQLDLIAQGLSPSDDSLREKVRGLSDRVRQLSSTVHGLSTLLHPSKLDQLGLVPAIRGLCRDFTLVHGLEIEYVDRPIPSSLPVDSALCLYRITQEALQNVFKHSGVRKALVELGADEFEVSLRVVDNGAGFDGATLNDGEGLGLVSMRERLFLVGGTIAIDSAPGQGTRINVRVPHSHPVETTNGDSKQSACAQPVPIG